jgi:hypothetical protein
MLTQDFDILDADYLTVDADDYADIFETARDYVASAAA